VKTLASRFAAFPEMKIEKSGYGAGSRDFPGHPNVLRLTIGEAASNALSAKTASETITVLEANLDDVESTGLWLCERMVAIRRRRRWNAFGMPVQMKKNRPRDVAHGLLCSLKTRAADGIPH